MKKIIAIGILGMFLLISTTAMSVAVQEESVSEKLLVEETTTDTCWIYGYVTNLRGQPLGDAEVIIRPDIWEPPDLYSNKTSTDSSGYYEFTDVPKDHEYDMLAQKDGYYQARKEIYTWPHIDKGRVDFTLIKKIISTTQGSQSSQQFTTTTTTTSTSQSTTSTTTSTTTSQTATSTPTGTTTETGQSSTNR